MKVGKEVFQVKGELIEVELHYTRTGGFQFKGIPEEVYSMTETAIGYTTENGLKNATLLALQQWHEMIKAERKVIAYRLFASSKLIRTREGRKPGVSGKFTSDGGFRIPDYAFGVDYKVYIELNSNGLKYFPIMENGEKCGRPEHIESEWIFIDYSEERELFFKGLGDNLQNLVYKVSAFFDSPELLSIMDSNSLKQLM
jgi:hypothetical protein